MKLKPNRLEQKTDSVHKDIKVVAKGVDLLNGRVDVLNQNFNTLNNKVENIFDTLDLIAQTVANHSEQLDQHSKILKTVVTKKDHQEVMNTLDKLVKLYTKKDNEMTLMSYRIQENTKDIEMIKPLVGLAV